MTTLNVQFSDGTKTTIIAYFANPQDPVLYPNQGTVVTSDPEWATFYDKQPAIAQGWLPTPG